MADRPVTRSAAAKSNTPETGDTTSGETHTWDRVTGGESELERGGGSLLGGGEQIESGIENIRLGANDNERNSNAGTVVNSAQSRLVLLMAELEAQKAELARAQAAAAAAQSRLEIARISDLANSSVVAGPPRVEESLHVEKWLSQQHLARPGAAGANRDYSAPNRESNTCHPQGSSIQGTDVQLLANAIMQAVNSSNNNREPPKFIRDLPHFDGSLTEWMAFRAVFSDTHRLFSDVQNVARLRKAVRGAARDSVKTLLYTSTDPFEIIDTLERRYGKPEFIILSEVENIKKMPRLTDDGRNIISFANKVANTVATIKSLDQHQYLYAPELVNRIVDKLTMILKYKWFEYKAAHTGAPDLVLLSRFLNSIGDQCGTMVSYDNLKEERRFKQHKPRVLHATRHRTVSGSSLSESDSECEHSYTVANLKKTSKNDKTIKNEKKPRNQPVASRPNPQPPATTKSKERKCAICEGNHSAPECADFKKLNIDERWARAKEYRLCFRYLSADHRRFFRCKCVPCGVDGCEVSHHRLLHNEKREFEQKGEGHTPTHGKVSSVSVNHVHQPNTYLKILPIEVTGPLGKIEMAALLDEGSSISLIDQAVADKIVPRDQSGGLLTIEGVGGSRLDDHDSRVVSLKIRGLCSRDIHTMTAHTMKQLDLAPQQVDRELVKRCEHLTDIRDELCYDKVKPTILIGQDNWHLITSRQLKIGGRNEPVASYVGLGAWVLHGRDSIKRGNIAYVNHVRPVSKQFEDETVKMMRDFFSIESLGIEPKTPKADPEKRAVKLLNETCRRIEECNRFEAGLLWRTDNDKLPNNRAQALSRLINIEKKLDKNVEQREEYTRQVNNLIESGYVERADSPPTSERAWYLPHFAVRHPQKGKIRLVFDAAAKFENKCLNDALLAGPDLLQSLFGVLIRFREGRIAVVADIKEMFLQIKIIEADRDSLRFLWRDDRTKPPIEYRSNSLVFGASSSPTTAIYVKNKNAGDHAREYPEVARATVRNFYMDDYLGAFDDENVAKSVVNAMHKVHSAASFELRGWASNAPEVISDVASKQSREQTALGKCDSERTLGLIWNHERDTLGFNVNLRNTPVELKAGDDSAITPTKRQVTSAVMSAFDPLGLISPVTAIGKALIQDVWRSGVQWDDPITQEHRQTWLAFIRNIEMMRNIEIARYVNAPSGVTEMHVFCDASEKIYATAIYFVNTDSNGNRTSRLVAGKAKVAPLKPISIPRLVLQAAVLGSRLADTIKRESDYQINKCHFWSDSKTVLAWIKSDPRSFKAFVAHRLAEIESLTAPVDWRWVPSALNVADDATKGMPASFDANHRWFFGPPFIRDDPETWPKEKPVPEPSVTTGEERSIKPVLHARTRIVDDYLLPIDRFSNYNRLLRSTAAVLAQNNI